MKRHLGSTIALILGVLSFVGGLASPATMTVAGPVMILGALACRSAKKRKLGEVKQSFLRKSLEATAFVAIVAIVSLQNNIATLVASDPVPNLIIPCWAVMAYLVIVSKKQKSTEEAGV